MGNASWFVLLLRLLYAAWGWFRNARREARIVAVRTDVSGSWLHKHGGTDERVAPGTDDAGGGDDKH